VRAANLGVRAFLNLVESVLWVASKIPGPFQDSAKRALTAFQNMEDEANNSMDAIESGIEALANTAKNNPTNLAVDNEDAIEDIADVKFRLAELHDRTVTVTVFTRRGGTGTGADVPVAAGGVFGWPTRALIGEAGPEAVVPLNRPLHLVDPAVRELSAIAQGMTRFAAGGVAGTAGPQKVVDVGGITVISPQADPRAVATETVNALTAVGY
jgi:hypothetical protein